MSLGCPFGFMTQPFKHTLFEGVKFPLGVSKSCCFAAITLLETHLCETFASTNAEYQRRLQELFFLMVR